jgi:hypothetical protein
VRRRRAMAELEMIDRNMVIYFAGGGDDDDDDDADEINYDCCEMVLGVGTVNVS